MARPRIALYALLAALLVAASAPAAMSYPKPGRTERVSIASDGSEGVPSQSDTPLSFSSLSRDGRYVVFESGLTRLDSRFANAIGIASGLYWRDRKKGRTELITVNPQGVHVPGPPGTFHKRPIVSATGRYVTFYSNSPTLVAPSSLTEPRIQNNVFVRDMRGGTTEIVSVGHDGSTADGPSDCADIDSSGRYISFTSDASNLTPADTKDGSDVFVHDRKSGKMEIVSVSSSGSQTSATDFDCPAISPNGRWIIFTTTGSDLVEDDLNQNRDVFIHDRKSGKTERVSKSSDGSEANGDSWLCGSGRSISSSGRYITFCSYAGNLVPNDTDINTYDVIVHDRKTGRNELISVSSQGEQTRAASAVHSTSDNGRIVAFQSADSTLDDRDTGASCLVSQCDDAPLAEPIVRGDTDVYVHDRIVGSTVMGSVASDGSEGTGCTGFSRTSYFPSISRDGKVISFASCADNLVAGDNNGATDVFVREIGKDLGVGWLSRAGVGGVNTRLSSSSICIQPGGCAPPNGVWSRRSSNDVDAALTAQGAALRSLSVALRPQLSDLFVNIELEHMPRVIPGLSPISYGLRFDVDDKSYEARATSLQGGTFGLYDCTNTRPQCTKVADLRGGYGTTGMRVVFSLPLDGIGLEEGGKLEDVTAFSALTSYTIEATQILDSLRLK